MKLWVSTIAPADIAFITQPGLTWTGHALVTALFGKQLRLLTFAGTRVTDDQPLSTPTCTAGSAR